MEKERKFYKLGKNASVFSDNVSGLKITKNVPGSTLKPNSKLTREAAGNGHITEITEKEWNEMMSKLSSKEKEMAYQEQGIQTGSSSASAEDDGDKGGSGAGEGDDAQRNELLDRLSKLKIPKSKKEEAKALSTEELKAFVEAEEGK